LLEVHEPPLTIHELARDVRISPFHFIRQFEAVFTEVCMEVGFSSRRSKWKTSLASSRD
jgi:hypothetical protein